MILYISTNLRKNLKNENISQLATKLMICIQNYSNTITKEQCIEVLRVLEKIYSVGWKDGAIFPVFGYHYTALSPTKFTCEKHTINLQVFFIVL